MNGKKISAEDQVLFTQMVEVLTAAMPALCAIDYTKYGEKYELYDSAGNRKYQGVMLQCYAGIKSDVLRKVIGTLQNEEEAATVLERKLDALLQNSGARSSLELRDPPRVWGGAIHVFGSFEIWGLTGLPEIVDHLVNAHLQLISGFISGPVWINLVDSGKACAQSAMSHAGMSPEQYESLSEVIAYIIMDADK